MAVSLYPKFEKGTGRLIAINLVVDVFLFVMGVLIAAAAMAA